MDSVGPPESGNLRFLSGGGLMGALMRAHDWTATPLGSPEQWPQSLRSLVSTCLNCSFPILLWWGRDLVKLYNDAYISILGDKHPAALGRPGRDVWPEIWDTIGPMLARVIEQGQAAPADDLLLLLHRHGYTEECYFSFSYSPIHDESGGVGGVFCPVLETTAKVIGARRLSTLSDLGAIERTDSAEAASAACARVMAKNGADLPFALIYLLDREVGLARLAGAAGLAPGAHGAPLTIPLDRAGDDGWPLRQLQTQGALLTDLHRRWPGLPPCRRWGEPPVEGFVQPIMLPGDTDPAAALVAGLSPRKRLDDDYRSFLTLVASQIGARIADAVALAAERRRTEALAELDRAKTAFFSNISHEFRTPLTLILGPLEEVLASADGADRARVEAAHRNALRLLRLVNTLLDFSRVEAGRTEMRRRATDLAALTAELASTFRSLCERAGLELVVDCPALPLPAQVDQEMWEKIVLNLLSNAFKFTFAGWIEVRLRAAGPMAALTVRDTGTGIPAHELPHLFERFYRVEGARGRSHEGSGIGLALVRDLVRLHGGEISVESEPGVGSSFTVLVPFGTEGATDNAAATPEPPAARAEVFLYEAERWLPDSSADAARVPPAAGQGGRVLLADDNADMRDYVRRLLATRGHQVEAVSDGEAALTAARVRRPDLILSDVMMPGMDGLALLAAVRADPALADVPVLLLSARAGEAARIQGLDSGADDYLIKPFTAAELIARVDVNVRLGRLRRQAAARERAELERLVAERTAERDQVWRNARDILVVADPEGVIRDVNPAWQTILGHTPEEVVGRQLTVFAPDLSSDRAVCVRHKDGSERWIAWHQTREDAAIENGAVYAYGRDVTGERRSAEALARTEETLRQAQKMDAVGQLTGGLAHDFNNLLTGIMGSLELLQMRVSQGRTNGLDRYLSGAYGAAKRASALTHRLLAFSRRQTLDPQPIGLNRLVEGMEDIIRRTMGPEIKVEVSTDDGLWITLVDPNQLENALLNLCINARDAMPGGGRLVIATANRPVDTPEARERGIEPGDYVSLRVTDSGMGMPPDIVARVFEPFFTTKPAGMGTGLGLSMVYGFARQSGGQVVIESVVGQGTSVQLLLPRFDGVEPKADAQSCHVRITRLQRTGTVLVVDDEPTVRALMAETLRELGCQVLEADDGADGLEALQAHHDIDVMVTDVGLPGGLNGRQLADVGRRLRPGLRVLFITGYTECAAMPHGPHETGMAILAKPFAVDDLARRVTELLAQA